MKAKLSVFVLACSALFFGCGDDTGSDSGDVGSSTSGTGADASSDGSASDTSDTTGSETGDTTGGPNPPEGMVLVPAGEFTMGCDFPGDLCTQEDESPAHLVRLDAFFMDVYEVTVGDYTACVDAGECIRLAEDIMMRNPSFSITNIGADQALAYCTWVGKRLPTEAEWEMAARGPESQTYPWGNDYGDIACTGILSCIGEVGDPRTSLGDVSPFGVIGMGGNVNEWVSDFYSDTYYSISPTENPQGPLSGERRVSRGGFFAAMPLQTRAVERWEQGPLGSQFVGFRCAQTLR